MKAPRREDFPYSSPQETGHRPRDIRSKDRSRSVICDPELLILSLFHSNFPVASLLLHVRSITTFARRVALYPRRFAQLTWTRHQFSPQFHDDVYAPGARKYSPCWLSMRIYCFNRCEVTLNDNGCIEKERTISCHIFLYGESRCV